MIVTTSVPSNTRGGIGWNVNSLKHLKLKYLTFLYILLKNRYC